MGTSSWPRVEEYLRLRSPVHVCTYPFVHVFFFLEEYWRLHNRSGLRVQDLV